MNGPMENPKDHKCTKNSTCSSNMAICWYSLYDISSPYHDLINAICKCWLDSGWSWEVTSRVKLGQLPEHSNYSLYFSKLCVVFFGFWYPLAIHIQNYNFLFPFRSFMLNVRTFQHMVSKTCWSILTCWIIKQIQEHRLTPIFSDLQTCGPFKKWWRSGRKRKYRE